MARSIQLGALLAFGFAVAWGTRTIAVEPPAAEGPLDFESLRQAVAKAIPLLEKGSAGSADQRTCFTCHNQALPVMALQVARERGFAVDAANFKRQVAHTVAHLEKGKKGYLEGSGQGGQVLAAGYSLWTLEAGEHAPDDLTAAVATYLLTYQRDADRYSHSGKRPPSSGSDFTATYVALRGLATYATPDQEADRTLRQERIAPWLLAAEPRETEDRVFRLWSLPYVAGGDEKIPQAAKDLLDSQREDGGWGQLDELPSDPYATGSALVVLQLEGKLPADHPAIDRGIRYLLKEQKEDGSWHVVTRAKPFQKYYESGFPHGKDQFISIAAASWSAWAIALRLPAK